MTREEGIRHIIGELRDYMILWEETLDEKGILLNADEVDAEQQLDYDSLLAVGITREEIAEAVSTL